MLEGETLATGAANPCPDCGLDLQLEVLHSAAGYYIGSQCNCGPYSRESGYFPNREAADTAMKSDGWLRRS